MTQDDIIRMAREAGFEEITKEFYDFAGLVAEAKREECAKICDELWRKGGWDYNAGRAADAIRARGQQ